MGLYTISFNLLTDTGIISDDLFVCGFVCEKLFIIKRSNVGKSLNCKENIMGWRQNGGLYGFKQRMTVSTISAGLPLVLKRSFPPSSAIKSWLNGLSISGDHSLSSVETFSSLKKYAFVEARKSKHCHTVQFHV